MNQTEATQILGNLGNEEEDYKSDCKDDWSETISNLVEVNTNGEISKSNIMDESIYIYTTTKLEEKEDNLLQTESNQYDERNAETPSQNEK
jgi:hypothetical protein